MKTKGLEKILHRIEGELSVQPYGKELIGLLKEAYLEARIYRRRPSGCSIVYSRNMDWCIDPGPRLPEAVDDPSIRR